MPQAPPPEAPATGKEERAPGAVVACHFRCGSVYWLARLSLLLPPPKGAEAGCALHVPSAASLRPGSPQSTPTYRSILRTPFPFPTPERSAVSNNSASPQRHLQLWVLKTGVASALAYGAVSLGCPCNVPPDMRAGSMQGLPPACCQDQAGSPQAWLPGMKG